jgi:hypothetical protein
MIQKHTNSIKPKRCRNLLIICKPKRSSLIADLKRLIFVKLNTVLLLKENLTII